MRSRQRYIPLLSRCCQRGGEVRIIPGGLITRKSGFYFCKIAGGRKFKSTPRYYFFQTGILSFQCRTSVMVLSNACVLSVLGYIIQFHSTLLSVSESFLCCGLCACTCRADSPYFSLRLHTLAHILHNGFNVS